MSDNVIDFERARRRKKDAEAGWEDDEAVSLSAERDLDGSFMTLRTETCSLIIEQSLDRDEANALALVLLNFARSPEHVQVAGGVAWSNAPTTQDGAVS